jgi:hypothetical protein
MHRAGRAWKSRLKKLSKKVIFHWRNRYLSSSIRLLVKHESRRQLINLYKRIFNHGNCEKSCGKETCRQESRSS